MKKKYKNKKMRKIEINQAKIEKNNENSENGIQKDCPGLKDLKRAPRTIQLHLKAGARKKQKNHRQK